MSPACSPTVRPISRPVIALARISAPASALPDTSASVLRIQYVFGGPPKKFTNWPSISFALEPDTRPISTTRVVVEQDDGALLSRPGFRAAEHEVAVEDRALEQRAEILVRRVAAEHTDEIALRREQQELIEPYFAGEVVEGERHFDRGMFAEFTVE